MNDFFPTGLSREAHELLSLCVHKSENSALGGLLGRVDQHVNDTRDAASRNSMVNVALAVVIADVLHGLVDDWDHVPSHARPWLRGMMCYFYEHGDEEPDFTSPIGFEDDVEVLNACLRLANREELCINPEDYDDA